MPKLIYTSYSPNTRAKDILMNILILLSPWFWYKGRYIEMITSIFEKRFHNSHLYTFNYARSGMYILFKSLNLTSIDEVIVQGFTCIAAVNPIICSGAKIIYCDIDEDTCNLDISDLKNKITANTKVIMFQHTFGNSTGIAQVKELCIERNILLIEDCTNTIFGKSGNAYIGSFGDASIFSFGRDKAVSGVDGGLILLNNKSLIQDFETLYADLPYPTVGWLIKELFYPLIWALIKATYTIGLGKLIHIVATKLHLITKATSDLEKSGFMSSDMPRLLPNALACLAYTQLQDINTINEHRAKINDFYKHELAGVQSVVYEAENILLRYPLFVKNKAESLKFLRKNNLQHFGDWYDKPITPINVEFAKIGYTLGSCKTSEDVCTRIINLPNHINISLTDAKLIVGYIKSAYGI